MIKVTIISKDQLRLEEDAKKGDIIDLSLIDSIDSSFLEKAIKVPLEKRVEETKEQLSKNFEAEKRSAIDAKQLEFNDKFNSLKEKLNEELSKLRNAKENADSEKSNGEKIQQMQFAKEKSELEKKLRDEYDREKTELFEKIDSLKMEKKIIETKLNSDIKLAKSEVTNELMNKYNEEKEKLKESFNSEKEDLKNKIAELTKQKSSLSTKLLGESLEKHCYNEVNSYMENGFENCKFWKDNDVVTEDNEKSGSKADFIFEIFADENKLEEQSLIRICLEMKESNPNSITKSKIESYFKKTDLNMKKKKCNYAVLVSNLEPDSDNESPIRKALEHPNMYIVRPAYLIVFLNLMVSLCKKYGSLILQKAKESQSFASEDELIKDFEDLRNTYLDKPLEQLKKNLESINKYNIIILENSKKITNELDDISSKYLKNIQDKLDKFNIKKLTKKIAALSEL